MNKCTPLCCALLWSGLLAGTPAFAQAVYRCDNVYSQTPCPGGTTVNTSDSRTLAQRQQADANAKLAAMQAAKMEKERLTMEKAAAARSPGKPTGPIVASKNAKGGDRPKTANETKKEPEFFTAAAKPPPKTVEKADKKTEQKAVKP